MAKSAQEKFNEYLSESAETTDAVNEFVNSSYENYQGYAYAAGALGVILGDAIAKLPRASRAEFRAQLYSLAQEQKNQCLVKKLKAA